MAELAVGSEVAGCRIEAVAGEGGMGIVYVATQLALRRRVALKVIAPDLARDPGFRERFKRESQLAAAIEHPNVIPVYEAGERDGLLYLVMRYVEGTDLRQLLTREGRLEPARAARLHAQVAAALGGAHRQGLVHRDVKPANVLLVTDEEGEHAYLTDFGIAREMSSGTAGLTRTGAVVGTVDYLAPERLAGARGDARSDIYAFGCMLFESLSGRIPFPAESDVAKMFAHANSEPPTLDQVQPGLPPALAAVVARCMAKDPEERYEDASVLARETAAAVESPPPASAPDHAAPTVAAPQAPPRVAAQPPTAAPAPPTAKAEPQPEPPTAPAQPTPRPPPAEPSHKRRRLVPVGVVASLVVGLIAAALILVLGGDGSEERRSVPGTQTINVPGGPDGLTVVGDKVWVASARSGKLTPIDRRTGKPGKAVQVGAEPDSVTSAAGSVWVTNTRDGTVSRVDDTSGARRGGPIEVGASPEGIAAGDGSIWVANAVDGGVSRIDAAGGGLRGSTQLGGMPIGVATSPGTVWVTDSRRGRLTRLSTSTGRQEGEPIRVGEGPRGVAVSGGDVWVANSEDGSVSRVDARSGRQKGRPIEVGGGPREVAAAGAGGVWVTLSRAGQAIRIDSAGKVAERKKVGSQPVGVAVGESNVWVAGFGDDTVTRIER